MMAPWVQKVCSENDSMQMLMSLLNSFVLAIFFCWMS